MEKCLNSNGVKTGTIFDKRQTNIAKGIALLMLLWHHLFYNSPDKYDMFISLFYIKGMPVECFVADFCKVCVAIFLFLSGYGLYKSYHSYVINLQKHNSKVSFKNDFIYVKNHLLKLLSGFWVIYFVFSLMGFSFGRNPMDVYQENILYFVTDIFGLSYLFDTPSINDTWWFISIILVYYLLVPMLYRITTYSAEIILAFTFLLMFVPYLIDWRQLNTWLFSLVIGMYFSKYNLFEVINARVDNIVKRFFLLFFAVISCIIVRFNVLDNSIIFDGVFAIVFVLLSYLVLSRIPIINKILEEVGKYSGQIFMFHTFIYSYYFKEQIYWFKYSIIIYLVMIIVCYIIARLLSWLMKVTRYNKLINKFTTIRG